MANKFSKKFTILFSIITILLISGCASKRYMNKALELENAGLVSEAADLYLRSLQANDDNIDSKLGLKRTGQTVIDRKNNEFQAFYRNKQYKEAVYTFLDIDNYRTQANRFGINLNVPPNTLAFYNEAKESYLNKQYHKGIDALNAENFSNALSLLDEVLKIDPNFRDASRYWVTARYEPVYRDGLSFLKSDKNRTAYYAFDEILKKNGEYKNASQLRSEAREKALMKIGIIPFNGINFSQRDIAQELRTYLTSNISQQNSPFYEIIESPLLSQTDITETIIRGVLLNKNEDYLKLPTDIDAILSGKINEYTSTTTPVRKTRRKAWLKTTSTITKEDGTKEKVTEYKKVFYYEYLRTSIFKMSISYSLRSMENNKVILSDVINKRIEDQVLFAEFDGDYKNLIPGTWESSVRDSDQDKIYDNRNSITELHSFFENRRRVTNSRELQKQGLEEISSQVAHHIVSYNPEI
ncbi:hypothetical protein [Marinilabilia sp.]|uniref:hypothetical protein n=1 Tax=Marinilabilia sp. TaxID=2021252 RepID=UPI0025C589B0|nr:hypothetical protein [Marinilabilia sp.]